MFSQHCSKGQDEGNLCRAGLTSFTKEGDNEKGRFQVQPPDRSVHHIPQTESHTEGN